MLPACVEVPVASSPPATTSSASAAASCIGSAAKAGSDASSQEHAQNDAPETRITIVLITARSQPATTSCLHLQQTLR